MSSHDPTKDDPRPREAVAWAVSELRGDEDIQDLLGVADATEAEDRLFQGRQTVAETTEAALPERFLVVRERVDAAGRKQTFSGLDYVPMQVMSECRETLPSLEQWHEDIQHRVYEVLVGRTPSIETGQVETPFRRSRRPGRPQYDSSDQTFYTTATYRLILSR